MPGIAQEDEEGARAKARSLARTAKIEGWALPGTRVGGPETVSQWFKRWLQFLRDRGGSSRQYRSNFANWIEPALGPRPIASVSAEEIRALVSQLNRAIESGKIRWKHATNIWGTLTSAFRSYAGPKGDHENGLVVRTDDPTRDVAGPKKGHKTDKVFLYPGELLKLGECPGVPLRRRRAWTIGVYMYLRPSETEALDWRDIDLENETYRIQRGLDRERASAPKTPKSGCARETADIEPELIPLLKAMHRESGGVGRVVGRLAHPTSIARTLRRDLKRAGVMRYELHNKSEKGEPAREWMEAHDLRTTGITWMAARGDSVLTIVARAGHSDLETTEHYVRKAALLRRTFKRQEVFPALPKALFGDGADESQVTPPPPVG
jgi:integrase